MTNQQLEKINKFTRRDFTEQEIYAFSVILCDNDIDRDGERFSDEALAQLQKLFVGKTGIFDHNAKSSNQNMRIYDTELVTDNSRKTKNGELYKYLKAYAYMVRTDENRSLIAEIDGGIKKEVSISCTASQRICSICGCDKSKTGCVHENGKVYNGRLCHTVLNNITDAYEWSFVAVPAQINAGVTKKFSDEANTIATSPDIQAVCKELRRDIRRLAFISQGYAAAENISKAAEFMDTMQLIEMKKALEINPSGRIEVQLALDNTESCETDSFVMN